jgi:hypothetical protein
MRPAFSLELAAGENNIPQPRKSAFVLSTGRLPPGDKSPSRPLRFLHAFRGNRMTGRPSRRQNGSFEEPPESSEDVTAAARIWLDITCHPLVCLRKDVTPLTSPENPLY